VLPHDLAVIAIRDGAQRYLKAIVDDSQASFDGINQ